MAAVVSFPLAPFDIPEKRPVLESLLTGVPALDRIIGGVPRATLTEIYGAPSSGRTSLLQSLLRTAMAHGHHCVWIDTPDAFDPRSAEAAGVPLAQLLWVRCHRKPEHALKAADLLVRAGGFSLVVLDLSGVPLRITNRIPMANWFRLRHGAEHSGAAILVTAETSNTGSCAKLQLSVKRDRILWSNNLLRGTAVFAFNPRRGRPQPVSFSTSL
jgi:hypothetical protein